MIKHIENSFVGMNREEDDGSYFLIPGSTQFPIFLNSTAHQIYSLCNTKTTGEVIAELSSLYPNISLKKIEDDVKNTLWYLYNIGLITIPDDYENSLDINTNIADQLSILNEQDFYTASKFVLKCIASESKETVKITNIEVNGFPRDVIQRYYEVSKLRMRHVMGTEVYYKFIHSGKEDVSVIIGISIHAFGRVAYVESIFADDVDTFEKAIRLMGNYLNTMNIEYLKFAITDNLDREIASTLLENGFKNEATLVAEAKEGNLTIISKLLK